MQRTPLFTPVLITGCIIMMVSFAVRASFGVFQIPIADEFGWARADFSLAIAIQNLAWGIGQPIFAAFAEKLGDRRAIILGAFTYAAGLVLSSYAVTPGQHQLLEILVGFGVAGTGFGVILAVVGRASSDENRSLSLGIATAAGSAGQVFGAPVAEWLLTMMTWQSVFMLFAAAVLATLLTLPMMRSPKAASKAELEESMGTILVRAAKDPTYGFIFLGFFSCGYQLAVILFPGDQVLGHGAIGLDRPDAVDATDRGHDNHVVPFQKRARGRVAHAVDLFVDLGFFLDIGVRPGDVGFWLVVVIVADEILNRVVREEALELSIKLRGQRLVGGKDDGRALGFLYHLGHGEGLAGAGGAQKHLIALALFHTCRQFRDCRGLVARGLEVGVHDEGAAAFQLFPRSYVGGRGVQDRHRTFGMCFGHGDSFVATFDHFLFRFKGRVFRRLGRVC